jgi:hypothetical protein
MKTLPTFDKNKILIHIFNSRYCSLSLVAVKKNGKKRSPEVQISSNMDKMQTFLKLCMAIKAKCTAMKTKLCCTYLVFSQLLYQTVV